MTNFDQKERERSILDYYLRITGLGGKVVPQEYPDLVITDRGRRKGGSDGWE